mmetsp:Transcript_56104/g.156315  ORF Transcript_56104/g.156315 Transcript_56104/m.156315 type:complete len:228 (+) Transcript_56104:78-761(+)
MVIGADFSLAYIARLGLPVCGAGTVGAAKSTLQAIESSVATSGSCAPVAPASRGEHPEVTPATLLLESLGIEFEHFVVSKDLVQEGETITMSFARQCGLQDDHAMVKTMVYDVGSAAEDPPVFAILPGDLKIDTKALATAGGWNRKNVKPTKPDRATEITGYVFGGTTALGSKTRLRVLLEQRVLDLPRLYVNGGSTRLVLALTPADYQRALQHGGDPPEVVELGKA